MSKLNLKITTNQFISLLVGYSLIVNILKLPVVVSYYTFQDAWFCIFLSGIYPILFFSLFYFVYKKYPGLNIFTLNKKLLGPYIGRLFNLAFYLYLFIYSTSQIAGFSMIFSDTVFKYFDSTIILVLLLIVAILGLNYKFKALIKFSQLTLCINLLLISFLAIFLSKGSINNIMPFLQTDIISLLKGIYFGSYAYIGFEIFLIYLPFIDSPSNYKKIAIGTSSILIAVFTWIIFFNLYILGPDVITCFYYPLLNILSSIEIPLLNNFIFIFMSTWALHCIRNSTLSLFNLTYCLNTKEAPFKVNILKTIPIVLLLFYIAFKINDVLTITFFINHFLIPFSMLILFNIFLLFLLSFRGDKSDSKN